MNQDPYKKLMILALAMVGAIIMATVMITYVKLSSAVSFNLGTQEPIILVGIVIGIVCVPTGLFIYRSMASKARQLSIDQDKMAAIRKAVILRQAVWEIGVIVNLYALWMANSWISLIVAGGIILLFLLFIPTPMRIKNDLEIE